VGDCAVVVRLRCEEEVGALEVRRRMVVMIQSEFCYRPCWDWDLECQVVRGCSRDEQGCSGLWKM
jgi:hypothetical protein